MRQLEAIITLLSRRRITFATALSVPVLILAQPTQHAILAFSPLLGAGVGLRTWARGHLQQRTRLTCDGPYAHVRHPLYVGSFLMCVGVAGMTSLHLLPPLLIALFVTAYWPKMMREEASLRQRWGAEWDRYAKAVGAVVPRFRPYVPLLDDGHREFAWRRVFAQYEWQTWLGTVAMLLWLWMRAT